MKKLRLIFYVAKIYIHSLNSNVVRMNDYYLLIGMIEWKNKIIISDERKAEYCLEWMACWFPVAKGKEKENNSKSLIHKP